MPIIHIHTIKDDESQDKYNSEKEESLRKLHEYLNNDKDVFALVYMNGCGPCESTKPIWHELKQKYHGDDSICILDIEHTLLSDVNNDVIKRNINGFPTLRHIRGKTIQDYEDVEGIKKDRSLESFIQWLEKKKLKKSKESKELKKIIKSIKRHSSHHHNQRGGRSKSYKKRTYKKRHVKKRHFISRKR